MPELEGPYRGKLQRLEDLCQQMLAERRLIIASNRGPLEFTLQDDGSLVSRRGGGGMVTALTAAARFLPATWIATAMTEGDRRAAEQADGTLLKVPDNEIYVRFVVVPRNVYQRHYYVFCNPLLWFLQHYMWNTPRTPNIGRAIYEAWESGYVPVNEASSSRITTSTSPQPASAKRSPAPPSSTLHTSPGPDRATGASSPSSCARPSTRTSAPPISSASRPIAMSSTSSTAASRCSRVR